MVNITFEINDHQKSCLDFAEVDFEALLQSQIEGRVSQAETEIQQALLAAGLPVTGNKEVDVKSAFDAGVVVTAVQREADLVAALTPELTDEQRVEQELTRRRLIISGSTTIAEHEAKSAAGLKAVTTINALPAIGMVASDEQKALVQRLFAASQTEDALKAKAKALLDKDTLPANYAEDKYWS